MFLVSGYLYTGIRVTLISDAVKEKVYTGYREKDGLLTNVLGGKSRINFADTGQVWKLIKGHLFLLSGSYQNWRCTHVFKGGTF